MKIAMMTEGTYPFGFGGVSVWCDQIIRGMPGYDFKLVAIVATEAEPLVWSLPSNVSSLAAIPLWGSPPASRARGRREGLPLRLVSELIGSLLDSSAKAQGRFADVLHELWEFGQRGSISAGLASEKTVRLLSDTWADGWPGAGHAAPNMHDAVTAMQLLDHCLRPLAHPPVEADIAHAVTNGLGVLPALSAKWRHGTPIIVTGHR